MVYRVARHLVAGGLKEGGQEAAEQTAENLADRRQLVKDWASATNYTIQKPAWFKQLVSNIRIWMHNHGLGVKNLSDDDIANIVYRSAKAARAERRSMEGKRTGTDKSDYSDKSDGNGTRFMADGKYFEKWQDVIEHFKKDLEGVELNQEQQDIYDVVLQQKDKIRLRINDLNELEDIFVNFGSRQKGIRKLISVHYAGLRNPVTALEVLNIGDVIRRGKLAEEGNVEYPSSRRYELIASDGAVLKVIIDFNRKKDKNRSVINFYSDRTDPRGQASSGGVTDLSNNISQNPENASSTDKNGPSAAPDGAMEGKRTDTDRSDYSDKSDGNGALFTLNSNASEELKRQVKAMQGCVGPFLDQDGAEYARRFKEKYGITLDPDEAKIIASLAISENKSAHQKQVAADNAVRAWAYFKSFNPLFDFIANFAGSAGM